MFTPPAERHIESPDDYISRQGGFWLLGNESAATVLPYMGGCLSTGLSGCRTSTLFTASRQTLVIGVSRRQVPPSWLGSCWGQNDHLRAFCQLINLASLPAGVSVRSSDRLVALTGLHPKRMAARRSTLPPRAIYAGRGGATLIVGLQGAPLRIVITHPDGMVAVPEILQSLSTVHSFEQGRPASDRSSR
jgi:hypothetical protein